MAIMVNFFSKKVLQHFKFPGNTTVETCKIHFHLNAPINNASIFIKKTLLVSLLGQTGKCLTLSQLKV